MPAPIIGATIDFLGAQNLGAAVWDGEVPRYGADGLPITPESAVPDWPAVKVYSTETGFNRTWTFEDPYDDTGDIIIKIWTTSREELEDETAGLLGIIERLFAQATLWQGIDTANAGDGTSSNPSYIIKFLLKSWVSIQEEGIRTDKSELLYRGELHYEVSIHGGVATL